LICSITAILSGLGFFLLTFLVRADLLRSIDFDLTVRIQENVPVRLDEYFIMFGTLAKFQVIVPTLVVLLLLLRRWVLVVSSLFLLFVAHLLEIVGKEILFQPPPPFMFYRHPTDFIFPDLHTFDVSSYPSGHSMRVVFVVITLFAVLWSSPKISFPIRLGLGAGLAGFSFIIVFSRVSLGEHWTSDVLGGAFLGLMIAAINVIFVQVSWPGKSSSDIPHTRGKKVAE